MMEILIKGNYFSLFTDVNYLPLNSVVICDFVDIFVIFFNVITSIKFKKYQ